MGALHPETTEEQSATRSAAAVANTPEIGTGQRIAGGGGPPRPPERPQRSTGERWLAGVSIVVLIALAVGALALAVTLLVRRPTANVSPTPTTTTVPSPTSTAVALGPQSCPAAVAAPTHWQPIVNTVDPGGATVGQVSCASMMGVSSLQTLITAQRGDQTVDVLVFNNITATSPSLIYQMKGLLKGDAKISAISTLMTKEVDQHSSLNAGKSVNAMIADLFREFSWSTTVGAMHQIVFHGMFPDLTRYQAETDQAAVNGGQQPWKLSATSVASAMVTSVLGWPAATTVTTSLLSGGGPQDTHASVAVTGQHLGPTSTLTVTLSRLEGQSQPAVWEVDSVTAQDYTFTSPAPLSPLTSPVTVTGTGSPFEGDVGHIVLLDHLYTTIGQGRALVTQQTLPAPFSCSLSYTSTFTGGAQEGVLLIRGDMALSLPAREALEKVLIGANV